MGWRIGVDIGGTFTDVAAIHEQTGALAVAKVPTTPKDFSAGVLTGLESTLARYAIDPASVSFLSHATTVVTNALLEEKGADVALVTTRGFRDVLELRRSARADLYDMFQDAPATLVPRYRRFEVTERLDAAGDVVTPLAEDELDAIIDALRAERVQAVAVSLLYSFLNDRHERTIGARLEAGLPGVSIFLSSEVLPEIREFERTSTTAVCAYVGPILESYLRRLETATSRLGLPRLYVMGSSGGVFDVAEGLKMPAMAVESGPAAGVIAASLVARQLDLPRVMSFDMGGTTAKASLVEDGKVETTAEYEVGGSGNVSRWLHGTGHPIRVPVIDLAEVSAGGGSIAWLDPGGALQVGPLSAGAEPGPACYGRGGNEPTVTDCDLVLGYLSPRALLDGDLTMDADAAREAIASRLATPLGIAVEEAAASVVDVVNASMAEALRIVSVERGHDPREFALIAFGGAGPVHAAALAGELEVPRVIVPPAPGAFSALGLVGTDLKREYSRTFYATVSATSAEALSAAFEEMAGKAAEMIAAAGIDAGQWSLSKSVDCRYPRQAYELNVDLPDAHINADTLAGLTDRFHTRHQATYGHAHQHEAVQIVNLRLTAVGRLGTVPLTAPASTSATHAAAERRALYFRGIGTVDAAIHRRDALATGARIDGPAVIESMDTTVLIPPGWRALLDVAGFLHLEQSA
ncbi:MAG: hydantoinase/oxoprolinase family protein [Pseudomonadota bacterium]